MKSILEKKGQLKGKRVLLRLSLNVPVEQGVVVNSFKLEKVLPTIDFLRKEGAKILILGYIGRQGNESLRPVANYFGQFFNISLRENFLEESIKEKIEGMEDGEVFLFENLRRFEGEKDNAVSFAKKLADLGDFYINEAFPDSHREYASIISLPKLLESYFGLNFIKEIEFLSSIKNKGESSLIILGGNKLKTKLAFIKNFLEKADNVFVGGALANDLLKVKGLEVGESLVSQEKIEIGDILANKKLILPIDVVVLKGEEILIRKVEEVEADEIIFDIGPETINSLQKKINKFRFVMWNGPLGNYQKGFVEGTFSVAQAIAQSKTESLVGGGDTAFCVDKLSLRDNFDFISTGGGAMLKYLIDGTLVGIEAIKNKLE